MKRKAKSFAEQDVVSRYWRRMYCWTKRAGATSSVKRGMRRRERRAAVEHIRKDPETA